MAITDQEINNPNVRKFLDFLGSAEGTDKFGYGTQVGNTQIADLSAHPRQTTVVTADGPSSAAGRYQFVKGTWDDQAKKHGLADFGPVSQDKAAVGLIKENGAYDDVVAGNYGSAINKLGGIWASLPSSPYKQAKKSWDWATAKLEGQGIDPARDYNNSTLQKGGMTPYEHIKKAQDRENSRDWMSPVRDAGVGFEASLNDNTGYNWFMTKAGDAVEDPNFRWTKELQEKYTAGVSDKYWDYIWKFATSEAHAAKLQANAKEYDQTEKRYEEAGFTAGAARMVGGIADPTNIGLIALTAYAPELGLPLARTRFSRIAYGAAEGALGNIAQEAILQKYRPEGSSGSELVFAGLMGTALGGVGGQFAHKRIDSAYHADLKDVNSWGLDKLNDMSAQDYATARIGIEQRNGTRYTPEELKFKEVEYISEYFQKGERLTAEGLVGPKVPEGVELKDPTEIKKTWSKEWDSPAIIEGSGKGGPQLHLPPNQPLESLIHYTRLHSPNKALVAIMDKMLEGIDVKNIRFFETGSGKQPDWYVHNPLSKNSAAHIVTPIGSRGTMAGDVLDFATRGAQKLSKGDRAVLRTGMTDGTFVHELVHVAAVYKQRLVPSTKDKNWAKKWGVDLSKIEGQPHIATAVKDLDNLYKHVLKVAKQAGLTKDHHYGLTNAYEFLAEGLSNPRFQALLRSYSLDGTNIKRSNVLTEFFNKVMDLLGIDPKENTAFHRLMEVAEPLVEPGGISSKGTVKAPPEGYRPAPDSKVTVDEAVAAQAGEVPEVLGFGLGLENRLNKGTLPAAVKSLAQKLFGTTIGYKNHAVVESNSWDDAVMFRDGWNAKFRKGSFLPFKTWMEDQGYKFYQGGEAFDKFGAEVSDYVRGFEREYHPEVKKAGEAVRQNMLDRLEDINNPNKTGSGFKKGLTETEVYDELGNVTGYTGKLEENPYYLPRSHDANKWNEMVSKHGRENVEAFWAAAYKSGREGITDEDAARFAKWYTRTVEQAKNQASGQHLTDMLRGQDKTALVDSIKLQLGLDDVAADNLARQILGQPKDDSGRIVANLKHRNTIDERFVGPTGSDIEGMTINDFIKTNALEITESYNNRVAGNVALAKNLDVYKASDVNKLIGDAVKNEFGSNYKEVNLKKAADDLQFAFDRILGVPQEEGFDPIRKGLSMVRNFNVIRLMSGAVFNQMVETAQITGTVGYRAMVQSLPEFGKFSRDIKTGKAPTDLLDHLENSFGGAGAQYLNRMDFGNRTQWVEHYGDSPKMRGLDRADATISKMAQKTLDWTGMSGMMVQQTRVHATALVNGFIDLAHGIDHGGAAFLTKDRLAWMGLSEDDFSNLKGLLKKYSSDGEGTIKAEAKQVDWDKFTAENPEMHHKFMRAIWRESRRTIQENDLGSMIPFMGTTIGKTVFQFMNFSMNAWNKQLLFGWNHKDGATLNTLAQGLVFGSMIYAGRTYGQSIGMEEEEKRKFLEERLAPHKIVANGFSRIGASSMLPNLASTFIPGASELFAGGRTTSDLSGLMSNPTLGFANGIITGTKKLTMNAVSSETQSTKADAKAMFKLLPLNNFMPINALFNHAISDLPTEKQE